MGFRLFAAAGVALAWAIGLGTQAVAEDPIRIAYIDSLSGSLAGVGQSALKHFQFAADQINAAGGVLGHQLAIVPFDNKGDAQESRVDAQKAADDNIRYITQGVSASGVALAISDFVSKYNSRNPGKEVLFLNYAATDPVLTNANCSYWHFRFDSNNDMKVTALVGYVAANPSIKKVYLINQDYSTGRAVRDKVLEILKAKRPDIQIVGNDLHPVLKVTDFSPYVAKIKESGADSVISGNWGPDIALLLKAAAEAGLPANWYTLYAYNPGGPTAIKQANLADRVFNASAGHANVDWAPAKEVQKGFRAKYDISLFYPQTFNELIMLTTAMKEANSIEPTVIAAKLEGMTTRNFYGLDQTMRKQDHQLLQSFFIATFEPTSGDMFDEEHTGWGWKTMAVIPPEASATPTTCEMPDRP
jgi:branched-chain amino acid transport system substrate-binding protein